MVLPFIHAFNKGNEIYGMLQMLRKKLRQGKGPRSKEGMEV